MKSKKMFTRRVDLRSRKAMVEYLQKHFRYDTARSWNRVTSYANDVKLHRLAGVDFSKALDIIETRKWQDKVNMVLGDFDRRYDYRYQLAFNGRSGGYIVLYLGCLEPSGYKSFCPECGQKNFQTATPGNNRCGVCRQDARVNYQTTHMKVTTWPGRGLDQDEDFQDFDLDQLRARCRLVMDLDSTCDILLAMLQWACQNAKIVEKVVYRPETIKVLECA